jgi:Fe-S cluster biogenesis protein NfuA
MVIRRRVSKLMSQAGSAEDLRSRIEAVIEEEVRPGLQADGGDVELVGVDQDRIVQIRLLGSCQGCASSIYSTTMGIEAAVKARVPEVRFLEAVL